MKNGYTFKTIDKQLDCLVIEIGIMSKDVS